MTNQSQWDCPFDNNEQNNNNSNNIFHLDDHEAVQVNHEDDLGI